MKQNITIDQAREINSPKAFEVIRQLVGSTVFVEIAEYFTIGRMIEFLDEYIGNKKLIITTGLGLRAETGYFTRNEKWAVGYGYRDEPVKLANTKYYSDDLCDALWESVKEILEKKE